MSTAPPPVRFALMGIAVATAWLSMSDGAGPPDVSASHEPAAVREALDRHPDEPVARSGEFIVRFRPGASAAARRAAAAEAGASFVRDLRLADHSLVRVPPGQERVYEQRMAASSDVLSVEPNLLRWAAFTPNDDFFSFQWHLSKIGLETAWDKTNGAGVTVAVLDTGVAFEDCSAATCGTEYFQALDFGGTTFVSPRDEISDNAHPNDENGHGTHVASTIGEATNNTIGVAGVAFGAQIMPVQILGANGEGSVADEIDGIMWAVNNGADVINLSLGGPGGIAAEQTAVDQAVAAGVVVVAAAGNGGADGIGDPVLDCPACYPSTISVGATRFDQQRTFYSNYGNGVDGHTLDIVAPGGDLTVDQNGDNFADGVLQQTFEHFCSGGPSDFSSFVYCFVNGTSMATPHIAGVAALVLSVDASLSPAQVRDVLTSTATDSGPAGYDLEYGNGVVNAAAAVADVQVDSDSDGCSDDRETAGKQFATSGGGRNPNNFWDFFDTPNVNNVRDRIIDTGDVLRVIQHFGTNDSDGTAPVNRNSDPLSAPPTTGYHPAFDRTMLGPNNWNLGPPNGIIDIGDILRSVFQFGHSCA